MQNLHVLSEIESGGIWTLEITAYSESESELSPYSSSSLCLFSSILYNFIKFCGKYSQWVVHVYLCLSREMVHFRIQACMCIRHEIRLDGHSKGRYSLLQRAEHAVRYQQ